MNTHVVALSIAIVGITVTLGFQTVKRQQAESQLKGWYAAEKCWAKANHNITHKQKAKSEVVATGLIYCFEKAKHGQP